MYSNNPGSYPYGAAQPSYPPYQYAQQPAPVQPRQNVDWISVSGYEGAEKHTVLANQTAWMMDNNKAQFYVKSADNLGVATIKAYRFEEINAAAPQPAQTASVDLSPIVEEMGEFKRRLEALENQRTAKKAGVKDE